jgi:hypothetical protein
MDIFLILVFITLLNLLVFGIINNTNSNISKSFLWALYIVHISLTLVYFIYAGITTSDSIAYYKVSSNSQDWVSFFQTGSPFIRFLAWPFSNLMQLSYYAVMLLFSYFGFLGILLLYAAAKENIQLQKRVYNLTPLEWVFLLPNIHFWSASIGKGSIMILGISLFVYGLSRFNYRIIYILLGAFIIYFTRPHILFTSIAGILTALLLTRSGINKGIKFFLIIVAFIAIYNLTDKVLEFTDTDNLNILNSSSIAHKAQELSKSTSGVDLSDYNPVAKLLTFWYRPLFFDAPGLMGVLVSFENILLIVFSFTILKVIIPKWKYFNGWFLICGFTFLLGSFALAQVSGNLGIALRQKAQLMPLFYIVYAKCIEYKQKNIFYEI